MKNLIAIRSNNLLFNGLMIFMGFTFMLVWLPLLRCAFDGTSYRWGQGYFGMSLASEGLSTGYLALIVFLILYLALFASFYWIKNRTVFYALLIWWWIHNFGNFLYEIIKNGDTMFHGDTLNVHVSLSAIIIPLSIIAVILIGFVIVKDKKLPEVSIPWGRSNRLKALILLTPVIAQVFLFSSGEPHDITDQIGVVMAIIQAILFPIIFFPAKFRDISVESSTDN